MLNSHQKLDMNSSNLRAIIVHNKELIQDYNKHLRILERQAARFGVYVPPHIQIEIDDVTERIQICKQMIERNRKELTLYAKAFYDNFQIEHDVYENNEKGMRIHISFVIENLEDVKFCAIVEFLRQSGEALRDYNGKFCTTNGLVACGREFTPTRHREAYPNFQIFMPYNELHLFNGNHKLMFRVKFYIYLTDCCFSASTYQKFNFKASPTLLDHINNIFNKNKLIFCSFISNFLFGLIFFIIITLTGVNLLSFISFIILWLSLLVSFIISVTIIIKKYNRI